MLTDTKNIHIINIMKVAHETYSAKDYGNNK